MFDQMYSSGGDVGTIATWPPGGRAILIMGHYWPIINFFLAIIDHYWLQGCRAIANILSVRALAPNNK